MGEGTRDNQLRSIRSVQGRARTGARLRQPASGRCPHPVSRQVRPGRHAAPTPPREKAPPLRQAPPDGRGPSGRMGGGSPQRAAGGERGPGTAPRAGQRSRWLWLRQIKP